MKKAIVLTLAMFVSVPLAFSAIVILLQKLLAGNLLRPLVIHIKVGDLYFEQACFAVGKNRIRVYARNITKRKIAEQALQTSEQNFRNSIDSSSMFILISD